MSPSDRSAASPVRRGSWRVVLLLMLVVGLGHFNRISISVAGAERIIPESAGDRAQMEVRMGQVYSAFLLLYTLAMTPTGWLIDRFGARAALMVLTFGSVFFVAATGAVGLACSSDVSLWIGLLVVRSLMGIVNAPLHPAAARTVFAHVPYGIASQANGLVTFAACAGIAATYYGFGTLIEVFGWPGAFLASSVITLAVALIWTWGTRDFQVERSTAATDQFDEPAASGIWTALLRRGVICITLSYVALGYFQYLFFYWIQYYFKTVDNQGPDVARRYSTLIMLAMGVGMVLGGRMADRVPASFSPGVRRRIVPMFGMIASGVVFELGVISPDRNLTFAAFTLSAGLLGMCEGAFWTTAVELGGRYGGTAAGLMNTGGNAGGTLSPTIVPLLSEFFASHFGQESGWRMSLAVAGVVSIVGAFLWMGVDGREPAEVRLSALDPDRRPE